MIAQVELEELRHAGQMQYAVVGKLLAAAEGKQVIWFWCVRRFRTASVICPPASKLVSSCSRITARIVSQSCSESGCRGASWFAFQSI